jgi:hypothetical protein
MEVIRSPKTLMTMYMTPCHNSEDHERNIDSFQRFVLIPLSGRLIPDDKAVRTSKTSVYFKETTQHHIPDGSRRHTRRREKKNLTAISLYRRENLKSHTNIQLLSAESNTYWPLFHQNT